jgi:hypothetical protein
VHEDPNDAAERIERKTQRILWAAGLAFVVWQIAFFLLYLDGPPIGRSVDAVRSLAFLAWCAALLVLVATGGGAFASPAVKEVLDDELSRARRATAYRNGFWAMIVFAYGGYLLAHLTALGPLVVAHAVLSGGVVVAVLTLAYTNRG